MDNFAYLNQISQSTRPAKSPKVTGSISNLSIIKIATGGIVLFFLIMAFGLLLGSLNKKPTNLTKQLYTRTVNLNTTIGTYGSSLKTSQLRAINASLSSVLTNTSKQLSDYLTADNDKDNALIPDDKTLEEETANNLALDTSLNNAKLNGLLDRTYDNQIGLQVSLLISMTSELIARNKDSELDNILTTFYSSLNAIHQSIESYSNPSE